MSTGVSKEHILEEEEEGIQFIVVTPDMYEDVVLKHISDRKGTSTNIKIDKVGRFQKSHCRFYILKTIRFCWIMSNFV